MEERPKRKRGRYFKYKESVKPSFGVVPRSTQWSRKKRKCYSNGLSNMITEFNLSRRKPYYDIE